MNRTFRWVCAYLSSNIVMQIDNLRTYKRFLNLNKPKYYGEKLQWIKVYGNLERFTNIVDKYTVRDFIKKEIGEKYLTKLIAVYDSVDEIDYSLLPEKFVFKVNDGSDKNIICRNKSSLDINKTNKFLRKLFNEDYYKYTKEPQYKNIKKKIICEEYLEDKNGLLVEYDLHCFSGKVYIIEVHTDRYTQYKEDFFDTNWNIIKTRGKTPNSTFMLEKPKFLEELIHLAEKLSEDLEYVRVDFNAVNDKLYFSELTFTPANGTDRFNPLDVDLAVSKLINLEEYNKPFNKNICIENMEE